MEKSEMKENNCSMCENYLPDIKACSIAEMNLSASQILTISPQQEACHHFKEMKVEIFSG